jgi:hypothetical protein
LVTLEHERQQSTFLPPPQSAEPVAAEDERGLTTNQTLNARRHTNTDKAEPQSILFM